MTEVKITYSGFHDAPLAFVVSYAGIQYLFWRVFDDALDDYPDEYDVFILPNFSEEEVKKAWSSLPDKAKAYVGKMPVNQIVFDPTKRHSVDAAILEKLPK